MKALYVFDYYSIRHVLIHPLQAEPARGLRPTPPKIKQVPLSIPSLVGLMIPKVGTSSKQPNPWDA